MRIRVVANRGACRLLACPGDERIERVEELARMLGGVEITRKAREHAREMLKAAAR